MALPVYVKRARNNYNAKHELIQLRLPPGSKERIKTIIGDDGSMASFCVDAILETIDGYEAVERWTYDEQQYTTPECPQETREEDETETVKKASKDGVKPAEKKDNAVVLAELQATVDRKRQEQEERKEKLEQEKKARQEAEREEKRAEMRAYVERMRTGSGLSMEEAALVQGIMKDRGLLKKLLVPEDEERAREDLGDRVYDELVKLDKERRREETKAQERLLDQCPDQDPGFMDGVDII